MALRTTVSLSSGEWIRTTDLQVMSPKSGAGTIDPQAPSFRVAFGSLVRRGQTINDCDYTYDSALNSKCQVRTHCNFYK